MLSNLDKTMLQDQLKKKGLPISGNKKALMERLISGQGDKRKKDHSMRAIDKAN